MSQPGSNPKPSVEMHNKGLIATLSGWLICVGIMLIVADVAHYAQGTATVGSPLFAAGCFLFIGALIAVAKEE